MYRLRQEVKLPGGTLTLVRADAAELPLATGAIDAVHAGAALHHVRMIESLIMLVA